MGQCMGKKRRISIRMQATAFLMALFAVASASSHALQPDAPGKPDGALVLHDGWGLHSGCGFFDNGDRISKAEYNAAGWLSTSAPSTVLAAQVASGEFKDPYYAMSLRHIPGTGYPIGEIFSNLPMPQNSPYRCAWWYRHSFHVEPMQKGAHLWLHFAGINYRANIWLNGKLVANDTQIAGAYRVYDLDVTGAAAKDGSNTLAVEVYAPHENDLGINWVDWNPSPPDKDMGLVGPVTVKVAGPVLLQAPTVATHFTDESLSTAELTVYAAAQLKQLPGRCNSRRRAPGPALVKAGEAGTMGNGDGYICAAGVSVAAHTTSADMVALSDGNTAPGDTEHERSVVEWVERRCNGAFRDSRDDQRTDGEQLAPV
jgi:hypothetical protein